jgi:D-sedoheptulose 7-phosphate isomerase
MLDARTFAQCYFQQSQEVLKRTAERPDFIEAITACAARIERCLRENGKLLIAGNGGSAADAQHIAGEFLSHLNFDRRPLPAIALTTDGSVLTALSNDYGFEQVFGRQLRGLGRRGDVFIAISTTGNSANILHALKVAREIELTTIGFTGVKGTAMVSLCDLALIVASDATPLVQQIHITAAHVICELVEANLFGK